ncbi:hypothetical protein GCM10009804_10970 [Kribbella hippodromi]|uniref:Sensor domain-containing protein n=1 Tax=Kribbella hippodromi TaxID=434347 RepID=A0ABN2CEB1_9ACTN
MVVAAFALTVAGCSGQPEDDIDPVVGTPSVTPVVPLSVAQATKAALLVSDLPKGWDGGVAADALPTPGYRGEYDPPECLVFRHPTDLLGTPTTAVRGQYFIREPGASVTEFIWSWPTRLDSFVADLTALLPKCSKYTMVSSDKVKYTWTATRLVVPGVAGAFALRYRSSAPDGDPIPVMYTAYVVRGGTIVDLEADIGFTDATFSRLVAKAAARLNAAVGP